MVDPAPDLPSRQFVDSEGVEWRVTEIAMVSFDHSSRPRRQHFWDRWLTFSSAVGKFRLAPVPGEWPTSSREHLERWLNSARLAAEARRDTVKSARPQGATPAGDRPQAAAPAAATEPVRSFHDVLGRLWEVREEQAPPIPNPPGSRCLVFDCGIITRRVWEYPPDWRSLPDAELERVSRRR